VEASAGRLEWRLQPVGWSGGFSRSAVGIPPHTQIARDYRRPAKASTPKPLNSWKDQQWLLNRMVSLCSQPLLKTAYWMYWS